jgi:hypothetical protein
MLQMKYEYGELRWNGIVRGKPKDFDSNMSQYHFVHHKSNIN